MQVVTDHMCLLQKHNCKFVHYIEIWVYIVILSLFLKSAIFWQLVKYDNIRYCPHDIDRGKADNTKIWNYHLSRQKMTSDIELSPVQNGVNLQINTWHSFCSFSYSYSLCSHCILIRSRHGIFAFCLYICKLHSMAVAVLLFSNCM